MMEDKPEEKLHAHWTNCEPETVESWVWDLEHELFHAAISIQVLQDTNLPESKKQKQIDDDFVPIYQYLLSALQIGFVTSQEEAAIARVIASAHDGKPIPEYEPELWKIFGKEKN